MQKWSEFWNQIFYPHILVLLCWQTIYIICINIYVTFKCRLLRFTCWNLHNKPVTYLMLCCHLIVTLKCQILKPYHDLLTKCILVYMIWLIWLCSFCMTTVNYEWICGKTTKLIYLKTKETKNYLRDISFLLFTSTICRWIA